MDLLRNKWLTVGLCAYEIAAILSKKDNAPPERPQLPTITEFVRRYPVVGVTLTTAMGWHFITEVKENRK